MASVTANGITIEYETAGDPANPSLLLIMGLGAQLIAWDEELVELFARQGFHVVRFDNRDVGLSTWFDDAGLPNMASFLSGDPPAAPYLLKDMADDAAALCDALGLGVVHVLGVSMGGMIAQALAIGYPERVRTLTSIMSTTGDHSVGQAHPEAMAALLTPPPTEREVVIEQAVSTWKVIGSPGFPFDEAKVRRNAAAAFDRAFHPAGPARQLVAILSSPDRTPALRQLECPTLVVHGEADPLVDPSGGRATADAVPGADAWYVPGMGHDLPRDLYEELVDRVSTHCSKA